MLSKSHTKYIQSLHHKKFRDEYGEFLVEGTKIIEELIDKPNLVCKQLFALNSWVTQHQNINKNIIEVEEYELEKISTLQTPNKVIGVFEKLPSIENFDTKNKITLVLDGIQDPGNFGTIIRTADWFDVENIVCSNQCADMYNAKVIQSSMGSFVNVNIVYTELVAWLQQKNIKKYATTLNGKNINDYKQLKEGIVIIGNEGNGISNEVMALVDENLTIPKKGHAESLNAAVAAGIVLSCIS